MNKKVEKVIKNVYKGSNELTTEFEDSVEVNGTTFILSVCPRHRIQANTIEYLTDAELQLYYDSYSLTQISKMVEADAYPLKLISTYETGDIVSIGTELDNNGEINVDITLEDMLDIYGTEFTKHLKEEEEED